MTTKTKSIKQKLFFSAMIMAFLWVIIGDLVSIHLNVIYGDTKSDWHQPLAKTQKTEKKTYKVGSHNSSDYSKLLHLSFIGENLFVLKVFSNKISHFTFDIQAFRISEDQTLFLRGPPSVA